MKDERHPRRLAELFPRFFFDRHAARPHLDVRAMLHVHRFMILFSHSPYLLLIDRITDDKVSGEIRALPG
jgi:hypothetical protein